MYFVWEQELEGLLGLDTCVLIYPYYNQEYHGILELICQFWYNITQIHTFSIGGRCGDHSYCGMTILSLQDDIWGYFWDLGAYFRFWFINTICSLAYTSSAVMNSGIYAGKFPLAYTKTASVAQWNYGASQKTSNRKIFTKIKNKLLTKLIYKFGM